MMKILSMMNIVLCITSKCFKEFIPRVVLNNSCYYENRNDSITSLLSHD